MSRAKDITGMKFNFIMPIRCVGSEHKQRMWECKCDCGNIFITSATLIITGHTKSCGCLKRRLASQRLRKHGQTDTRINRIWRRMKSRCNNPHAKDFSYYGGRGINVCEEWSDSFENFRDWANANGYSDTLTLDRIDTNKNYNPNNCRWVDRTTQSRNQRKNVNLTLYGVTKTLIEWSEICGLDRHTIRKRLNRGWDIEKVLTTVPTNSKKECREETARKIKEFMDKEGTKKCMEY